MLAGLASVFQRELDRPTIELYFRALADLPVTDVAAGCQDCLRNLTFFPKPHEIRERAFGGEGEAEHTAPERRALPDIRYPGMRHECAEVLAAFTGGRISLEGLQAWMRGMEARYPHIGWAEEAERLTDVLALRGGLNARYAPARWIDPEEIGRTAFGDPVVRPRTPRSGSPPLRAALQGALCDLVAATAPAPDAAPSPTAEPEPAEVPW